MVNDLHVEAQRTLSESSADSSHADNAEDLVLGIVLHGRGCSLLEFTLMRTELGIPELAKGGNDEEEGNSRGAVVDGARRVGNLDACNHDVSEYSVDEYAEALQIERKSLGTKHRRNGPLALQDATSMGCFESYGLIER